MILTAAPRLILAGDWAVHFARWHCGAHVAVLPLSLLGMLVAGMSGAIAGLATWLGLSSAAMLVSTAGLAGFAGGVVLCWLKYGRDILPPRSILSIACYAIGKLPLYRQMLSGKRGRQWIRTDRGKT